MTVEYANLICPVAHDSEMSMKPATVDSFHLGLTNPLGNFFSSSSGAAAIPEGKRIVYLPAPGEYRAERRTPKAAEVATCTHDANGASAPRYGAHFSSPEQSESVAAGAVWPRRNEVKSLGGEAGSGTCGRVYFPHGESLGLSAAQRRRPRSSDLPSNVCLAPPGDSYWREATPAIDAGP